MLTTEVTNIWNMYEHCLLCLLKGRAASRVEPLWLRHRETATRRRHSRDGDPASKRQIGISLGLSTIWGGANQTLQRPPVRGNAGGKGGGTIVCSSPSSSGFQPFVPLLFLGHQHLVLSPVLHLHLDEGISLFLRDRGSKIVKVGHRGSELLERDISRPVEALPNEVVKPHPTLCLALSHQRREPLFREHIAPKGLPPFFF